ncbi:MAG: tetratricopeptide repeat protein [Verrucomicrobiota bacterium]|jgi:tetratricopeptide (TPR) repeat protein
MSKLWLRWGSWVVPLALAAAVLAVYWPALHCGFLYYDDTDYVTRNAHVQQGLNLQSVKWALSTTDANNWHPLTWISHIVDFQLYGLQPAGHHLSSVLFHLANSVLLLVLLRRLTGGLWRSALAAALFALHPLRVESVVWISERKDVLSALFWMLTIWAYARYAEEFKNQSSKIKGYYAAAVVLFALGLMAKPMLVTLPFVLLLLDYWPLRRPCRVVEKIPFFLLAAACCVVTFMVQYRSGAVSSLAKIPLGERLANLPVAYTRYLGRIFWPRGLAVFYPYDPLPTWKVIAAVGLLALVTGWVVRQWRAQPWLGVGWFWFLGTLVPSIGLVQVGEQSMADRYSYLPSIGIFIMVAWGLQSWAASQPFRLKAAALAGTLAVVACALLTPLQVSHWKNTQSLFKHAVEVTRQNYVAYYNLGCTLAIDGDKPAGLRCMEEALQANPRYAPAHNNLGCGLLEEGQVAEAIGHFKAAVASQPGYAVGYYNLGRAFMTNHQADDAIQSLEKAAELEPDSIDYNYTLGQALLEKGRGGEARERLQKVVALRPDFADAHYQLANALAQEGRTAQAIDHYWRALALRPNFALAASHLAWVLSTCPDAALRDGAKALSLARNASANTGAKDPAILGALAAAFAETGNYADAVATARHAYQFALQQTNGPLAEELDAQLRQYQSGAPYREGAHGH